MTSSSTPTCSIWGDGVQLDRQGEVGVFVVVQGVAVAPAAIEEPLPTEHRPVSQVQPQVLPHFTLLTLPTTGWQRPEQTPRCSKRVIMSDIFI